MKTFKELSALLLLSLAICLYPTKVAHASHCDVDDESRRSDLICVARCIAGAEASSDFLFGGKISYRRTTWTFQTTDVLKGAVPGDTATVVTDRLDRAATQASGIGTYSSPINYCDFIVGATYLMLLKAGQEGAFVLTNAGSTSYSALELTEPNLAYDKTKPLLLAMLDISISNLISSDPNICIRGMQFVQGYVTLLQDNPNYPADVTPWSNSQAIPPTEPKKTKLAPAVTSIRDKIATDVVPILFARSHDANSEVSMTATITLGFLQETSVIPQLATWADGSGPQADGAIEALEDYASDQSAMILAGYLTSPSTHVRETVICSILKSQNPQLLPLVLPCMHDQDIHVVYYATQSLANITGLMPYCTWNDFPGQESKYVLFWNNWAATHSALLKSLQSSG